MAFISKNEINKFRFDDCVLNELDRDKSTMHLSVDALIVKANNSQNSNYTDSYADTAMITLKNIEIVALLKEGYNRYDADDNLLEEIPDEPIAPSDYPETFKSWAGAYLARFEEEDGEYVIEIEMTDEVGAIADSYELHVASDNLTVTWERYLNRVQS